MTRIKSRHPVREAVSSWSSGDRYEKPRHWWNNVIAELNEHGLRFASPEMPLIHTFEGRGLLEIFDANGENTGCALCYTWYTEGVGSRWEMIGYIT